MFMFMHFTPAESLCHDAGFAGFKATGAGRSRFLDPRQIIGGWLITRHCAIFVVITLPVIHNSQFFKKILSILTFLRHSSCFTEIDRPALVYFQLLQYFFCALISTFSISRCDLSFHLNNTAAQRIRQFEIDK